MIIYYQTTLQDNLSVQSKRSDYVKTCKPLSIDEIEVLETTYNDGKAFPAALRELLYLAGKRCYVLDYGWNDSQQEMQQAVRAKLQKYNKSIPRPFFAIDVYIPEQFLFVYLDEGIEDPLIYEAAMPVSSWDDGPWPRSLEIKLSIYIEDLVNEVKKGYNPF